MFTLNNINKYRKEFNRIIFNQIKNIKTKNIIEFYLLFDYKQRHKNYKETKQNLYMEILVTILFLIVVGFLTLLRNTAKKQNKKYSIIDDFLLYGGIPVALGYFLFIMFNPNNQDKAFEDVIVESKCNIYYLLVWMILSTLLFCIRQIPNKNQNKKEE